MNIVKKTAVGIMAGLSVVTATGVATAPTAEASYVIHHDVTQYVKGKGYICYGPNTNWSQDPLNTWHDGCFGAGGWAACAVARRDRDAADKFFNEPHYLGKCHPGYYRNGKKIYRGVVFDYTEFPS